MDYAKEIEKFLTEKRSRGLMIFHKEWLLIEKWETMGIPINIIKEGIENAIDGLNFSEKDNLHITPTLKHCEKHILEYWKNFKENRAGKPDKIEEKNNLASFSNNLSGYLQNLRTRVESEINKIREKNSNVSEEIRAILSSSLDNLEEEIKSSKIKNMESLEKELELLDSKILNKLKEFLDKKTLSYLKNECEKKLLPYKNRMDKKEYSDSLDAMFASRLRKEYGVKSLIDCCI